MNQSLKMNQSISHYGLYFDTVVIIDGGSWIFIHQNHLLLFYDVKRADSSQQSLHILHNLSSVFSESSVFIFGSSCFVIVIFFSLEEATNRHSNFNFPQPAYWINMYKIQLNIEIIATVGVYAYLVNLQIPKIAFIITSSTLLFTGLYGVLRQTRFLHPANKVEPHIEAEWRSRIIGTVHAIILTIGSALCFLEWRHLLEPSHAWHVPVRSPENEYHPVLFASVFVGYLQYDFLWLIYHRKKNFDAGSMIHHALYIAITHYVLHGYYFVRLFAWLSFCEVSTPFLHLRWFCAVSNKKDSKWYTIWSLLFAATFLFSRVLCYGFGLIDIWYHRSYWLPLPYGLYSVIAGVHLGYVLNLFWAVKVISAAKKQMKKKKR